MFWEKKNNLLNHFSNVCSSADVSSLSKFSAAAGSVQYAFEIPRFSHYHVGSNLKAGPPVEQAMFRKHTYQNKD